MNMDRTKAELAVIEAAVRYAQARDQVNAVKIPQHSKHPQNCDALFAEMIDAESILLHYVKMYTHVRPARQVVVPGP